MKAAQQQHDILSLDLIRLWQRKQPERYLQTSRPDSSNEIFFGKDSKKVTVQIFQSSKISKTSKYHDFSRFRVLEPIFSLQQHNSYYAVKEAELYFK